MTRVVYVEADGTVHELDVRNGVSLMHGAVHNLVPGIEGDCGGLCACGTCHVYIASPWKERCPEADELERAILDFAFDVREDSRLACQVEVRDELDGIVVQMPARQY
jgi:2Fe-2S ferredoxin